MHLRKHWVSSVSYTHLRDGTETLAGIKIGDVIAGIGDTVLFDGKRMHVERSDAI